MKLMNAMHSGSAGFRNLKVGTACLFMVFAGGALSTASPQAAAQQAAAALEEVIVTARKRAESLQDVPVSVTAFTESALKQAGIESMQDLSDFTPGFDFAQAFGRQDFRPAIRGQSTIQGGANAGLFIDGFFIGDGAPTVPYAALERVEVAKGPQSALYGRSTLAGAINYILKRPTEDYEGVLEVGIGEDSEFRTELTFSGPLGGNAGFMVSFSGYTYDGQYTNRFRGFPDPTDPQGGQLEDGDGNPFLRDVGKSVNIGEEETFSVVALLEYDLSDRIKITGRLMKEETEDGPYGIAIQPGGVFKTSPPSEVFYNNCAFGTAYGRTGYYCGEVDVEKVLDDEYDNKLNLDTGFYDLGLEYDATRISATLEYDLDWAMMTVNAAWHDHDRRTRQDQSFGPSRPGVGDVNLNATEQSRASFISDGKSETNESQLEVRFASPEDESLRWILGAYWYDFELEAEGRNSGVDAASTSSPTVIAAPGADNVFEARPDEERTNWAVFAAVEYDLSDVLTLGLEVRYNEEEVERTDIKFCEDKVDLPVGCSENPTGQQSEIQTGDFSETYKETLYRLTADYQFNEDVLFYGVIATGNKPGDFNDFGDRPIYASEVPVKESKAITYEAGIKANAWEDRLQLTAAAYATEWEDQQLTFTTSGADGEGASSFLNNLGETKIAGLELDLRARLTDFWELRLAYAYTDTEIKEYVVRPTRSNAGSGDFVLGSSYREAAAVFDPQRVVQGHAIDFRNSVLGGPGFNVVYQNAQDVTLASYSGGVRTTAAANGFTGQVAGAIGDNDCNAQYLSNCPAIDGSGGELPQVSKNQLSLSNIFTGVLANGMDWYVRVDYLHRSKRYAQLYNLAHTGESDVVHFRAGISLDALVEQYLGRGGLEVALWGRNLTDDQTAPALIRYVETRGMTRAIGFTLPEQQHFGVDLTYRF